MRRSDVDYTHQGSARQDPLNLGIRLRCLSTRQETPSQSRSFLYALLGGGGQILHQQQMNKQMQASQ